MYYPVQLHLLRVPGNHVRVAAADGGPAALLLHRVLVVVVPGRSVTCVLHAYYKRTVGVTSVRVANRLVYFFKRLAHFIMLQLSSYIYYYNSCLVSDTGFLFFIITPPYCLAYLSGAQIECVTKNLI